MTEPDDDDRDEPDPAPVELPIGDTLDLHSFLPREVPDVVRDYLDAAYEAGFRTVRIVHGRGVGVQRATVRAILERDPRVVRCGDAADASGWGATVAELR
jgi:dsDNA-specific endonuclease/ATPase MutS2